MRRPIIIGLVFIAILAIAGVLLLSGGGGEDTPPTTTTTTTTTGTVATPSPAATTSTPTPTTQQPVAPAAAAPAEVRARIAAWADGLNALGYRVTFGDVTGTAAAPTVNALSIAGPEGDQLAWSWTGARARIEETDATHRTIQVSGDQTLTFAIGGETVTRTFSGTTRVLVETDAAGRAVDLTFDVNDLEIDDPAGGTPVTAERFSANLSRAAGDGAVPAGSVLTLTVADAVVPSATREPLGSTIDRFEIAIAFNRGLATPGFGTEFGTWRGVNDAPVTLSGIEIDWGLMAMTGSGALGLDTNGELRGTIQATFTGFLPMLDAFNVVRRYDAPLLAEYYAVFVEEISRVGAIPVTIPVVIRDGQIVLSDPGRGLGDLVLGTLPPLLTPGGG